MFEDNYACLLNTLTESKIEETHDKFQTKFYSPTFMQSSSVRQLKVEKTSHHSRVLIEHLLNSPRISGVRFKEYR